MSRWLAHCVAQVVVEIFFYQPSLISLFSRSAAAKSHSEDRYDRLLIVLDEEVPIQWADGIQALSLPFQIPLWRTILKRHRTLAVITPLWFRYLDLRKRTRVRVNAVRASIWHLFNPEVNSVPNTAPVFFVTFPYISQGKTESLVLAKTSKGARHPGDDHRAAELGCLRET
jgi:hypothetical protein